MESKGSELHLPLITPICILSYVLLFVMVSYHVLIDSLLYAKHIVTCQSLAVPYVELMMYIFKCHISWSASPPLCNTTHMLQTLNFLLVSLVCNSSVSLWSSSLLQLCNNCADTQIGALACGNTMCLRGEGKNFETSCAIFETSSTVKKLHVQMKLCQTTEVLHELKLHNLLRKCDSGKANVAGRRPSKFLKSCW